MNGGLLEALASHASASDRKLSPVPAAGTVKAKLGSGHDAITDYMVVHDRRWRILRTNRSLAAHLGVSPVALEARPSTRCGS